MEPRMNSYRANPAVVEPLMAIGKAVHDSGLDTKLVQLIEIRASQINGCGF